MSELNFCRQFLAALDSRPVKLSSDHIADARQYPATGNFLLPRLPHPPHPPRPSPKSSTSTSATTLTITLKPLKPSTPTHSLSQIEPTKSSIYDLKTAYATHTSLPAAKIKILYKKKPVPDSKTIAEVIGDDARADAGIEFGVMVMGGAVPVTSPPAAAPGEAEKGLAGAAETAASVPAAQGPSGKEVVGTEEFWSDLKNFVTQRIRDEKEGERLAGVFKSAWEKER